MTNFVRYLKMIAVTTVFVIGMVCIVGTGGGGGGSNNTGTSSIDFKVNESDWRFIRNDIDVGGDGTIDHVEKRIYDDNGNRILETGDRGNDGTIDIQKSYSYDANNYLTGIAEDDDEDGISESHSLTTDANGMPIFDSVDHNNDTIPDYTIAYTYDLNRYPRSLTVTNLTGATHIKFWEWDEASPSIENESEESYSGGVQSNFSREYTYNGSGDKIREETDWNSDGHVDNVTAWVISMQGNQKIEKEDRDDDGFFEWVEYTTYDGNGNELSEETDIGDTGSLDEGEYYSNDAYGNLIKEEKYDQLDGTPDEISYLSYAVDNSGNLIVTIREDDDGDGNIDVVYTMTLEPR